jgi:hypothetical protein
MYITNHSRCGCIPVNFSEKGETMHLATFRHPMNFIMHFMKNVQRKLSVSQCMADLADNSKEWL